MNSFAKKPLQWFNNNMKSLSSNVKDKLIEKYKGNDQNKITSKSTNINVLLNRVRVNQKKESRKKLYFSAAASAGLFLFGFIIF